MQRVGPRAQDRQGGDAPDAGHQEARDEEEAGAGVDAPPGARVARGEHALDRRLPGQHRGQLQAGVEQEVGPAHRRVGQRVEAAGAAMRLHGVDQRAPADVAQDQEGDHQQSGAHHHELQEVGHQHREHAPQHRVDGDQQEQRRHRDLEQVRGHPATGARGGARTRHLQQELAARPQEHAHVQQAAEHDDHAGGPAHARAEALLEELGQRGDARLAQRPHAEAGQADDEHRRRLQQAGNRAGEAVEEAVLRRVHAGDDAELGGGQAGDAQVDVDLAAGQQEVLDAPHVPPHRKPGEHRAQQVEADDGAVDRAESAHAVSCSSRMRATRARRSSACRDSERSSANWARHRSRLWPGRWTA